MCGIAAYIGKKEAAPILLGSIKKLEYRGYDSCGIATVCDSELECRKGTGKIREVDSQMSLSELNGTVGIAHTRWATHGEPNDANAHPHLNFNEEIAIVHNGIIENANVLKKVLIKKGYEFRSETDTEVVVHLIDNFIKEGNLMGDAFMKALKTIEGAFAIVAINKNKPHKLYVAKKGSPLVLGIGEDEVFVASDTLPILPYTKNVVYLHDGDVGIITENNFTIRDLGNLDVSRDVSVLNEDVEEISKQGFDHYMLKEIFEQPESISRAFKGRIEKGYPRLDGLNIPDSELSGIKRIILLGCGTSWHACLVGAYLFEGISKIPTLVEYASEFRYRDPILSSSDLVIALSQSGETADTIAALEEAKSKGARTLGIVNVVSSSIARMVEGGVYMKAGREIGVASTKAFTSNLVSLYLMSVYFGRLRKVVSDGKSLRMMEELSKIPGLVQEILNESGNIERIASKYFNSSNALYLGRNYNFPIALEGALKLKEISYIHAEGYPAAEMKHGPIALIDENMPVVVIAPEGRLYGKVLSNISEVKSRKGKVIVITTNGLEDFDEVIKIPKVSESLMPLLSVIPTQLLAYYIAKKRGCEIDKPRNLAKSVTVE
jgi:glutamine---fructose-6-phosphate transaminase (isomerizing)